MFFLSREDLFTMMESIPGDLYHKKCIMEFVSDGYFANRGCEHGIYKLITKGMCISNDSVRKIDTLLKPPLDRFNVLPEYKTLLIAELAIIGNVYSFSYIEQVFEEWVLKKLDNFIASVRPIGDRESFLELFENMMNSLLDMIIKFKTKDRLSLITLRLLVVSDRGLFFY